MKLNCKAGDLAITVKCHVLDNLGKIVEVVSFEGLVDWPHYEDPIPVWLIKSYPGSSGLTYLFPDGTVKRTETGLVPDCFLRPISGLELEDEVSNTEDVPINEKTEA
jgi:hypothetical protein